MKSKKVLFTILKEKYPNKIDIDIGKHGISDETYGNKSFLYFFNVNANWGITRKELEQLLTSNGFVVNESYDRGSDNVEVRVSYFKGHNWNE